MVVVFYGKLGIKNTGWGLVCKKKHPVIRRSRGATGCSAEVILAKIVALEWLLAAV
ncbi:hypothetical protein [Bartonella acomydis]|uniref:hypothetical protein n=1 Tax=Bartonella acomydis TaxID=686234 RepID=UPI0031EA3051